MNRSTPRAPGAKRRHRAVATILVGWIVATGSARALAQPELTAPPADGGSSLDAASLEARASQPPDGGSDALPPSPDAGVAAAPADRPPELLQRAEARYPEEAKAARLEGGVVLRLTVDKAGAVIAAEVVQPAGHGFDEAAREAALLCRFKPAERGGTPTVSRISFRYEFRLPPPEPSAPPPVAAAPEPPVLRTKLPAVEVPVDVTVTGEANVGRRLQRSAEAVTVIDMRKAQEQTADLGEVLARAPGVSVRRQGGLGSNAIIALNGLQGDQIALFVDSVPLDYSGYPGGIVNIPVNLVERVEIYRGVVPARFGLDALGGAINVVTTRAGKPYLNASYQVGSFGVHRLNTTGRYQKSGFLFGGNAFLDLAKNNYEMSNVKVARADLTDVTRNVDRWHDKYSAYGGRLEVGAVDKPWARRLLLGGFASTYSQEVQTNAVMSLPIGEVTSGQRTYGANLQYEVALLPKLELELMLNVAHLEVDFRDVGMYRYRFDGTIGRTIGTDPNKPTRGEIDGNPVDNTESQNLYLGRLGLLSKFLPGQVARIYATPQYIVRRTYDHLPGRVHYDLPEYAKALVVAAEYEASLFDGRLSNVVLGKYYYFSPTMYDRSERWVPVDPFTFKSTRVSEYWGAGDSLRYVLARWLILKASYEYAIRLPNADELFGNGLFVQRSNDLRPERSHNFNLGPRLELSQTRYGDFIVDVNAFLRETKDQIHNIVTAGFSSYKNISDTRTKGVEGSIWWQSPGRQLVLDGALTWLDSRNISKVGEFSAYYGMDMPGRPYRFASWGARFRVPDVARISDNLDFFYFGRAVNGYWRGWNIGNPQYKMSVPAQMTHSVGATFSTGMWGRARYSVTFEVDNVLDAVLFDVWGVQRPGRSFNLKLFAQL